RDAHNPVGCGKKRRGREKSLTFHRISGILFWQGRTGPVQYPGVAQLVACLTGGQEAAGSSPVTRTTSLRTTYRSQRLFYEKATSHSFCRSSFPNRTRLRWASIRFLFSKHTK